MKQLYGHPDIVDYKNNVLIYISKYRKFVPFDSDKAVKLYYFVFHTDSSNDENLQVEIYEEYFDLDSKIHYHQGKGPCVTLREMTGYDLRETYEKIQECCKKVK